MYIYIQVLNLMFMYRITKYFSALNPQIPLAEAVEDLPAAVGTAGCRPLSLVPRPVGAAAANRGPSQQAK